MCFFKKFKERRNKKRIEKEKALENAKAEEKVVEDKKEVKAEPKPKQEAKPKPNDPVEEKSKNTSPAKYHVSQNKDENSEYFKHWRVRKEGSDKTIKYFKTQLEAIDYATHLAEQADTSIVIHKVDGTIRKQDYKK